MQKKKDIYKSIFELYTDLGQDYLNGIKKVKPIELNGFMNLIVKKGRVLDVGCANGRDSNRFIKKGFEVIGIDLVDLFLKSARKNVPKAKFIKMNLLDLKFPKNHFDAIWAHAVLLHIVKKDMRKALLNFYRVLKPGGKLHIRTKKGNSVQNKSEILTNNKKRFSIYYTKKEMEEYAKNAGFKILQSKIYADELKRKNTKWVGIWAEKK